MSPGGLSYSLVGSGLWADPVAPAPSAEGWVFATENGVWDKVGGVWVNLGFPTDAFNIYHGCGVPGVDNTFLVLSDMNVAPFDERLFKSADNCATWTDITPPDLVGSVLTAYVQATDPLTYYVNSHSDLGVIWKTTDGGASWAKIVPSPGVGWDAGTGEFSIAGSIWHAGYNSSLGPSTQDGIRKVALAGGSLGTAISGISSRMASSVKASPALGSDVAYAFHNRVGSDQPTIWRISGTTPGPARTFPGEASGSMWDAAIKNDDTVVALVNDSLYKTTDGGANWTEVLNSADLAAGSRDAVMWVKDLIWVAMGGDFASGGHPFISTDDGDTWAVDATLTPGAGNFAAAVMRRYAA